MTKDILSITDLTREEIISIFEFSKKLKRHFKRWGNNNYLKKKTLAMIFEKSSTRTRVSFEAGMFQLGGHALFLSKDDIQLGRGETISDTAKVLSRYVDGIMIRAFSHDDLLEFARSASVPIINGLTDKYHPCQALTDFFTIYERDNNFDNIKLAYIGDGNNVANSLLLGAAILGIDISVASPKEYMPDAHMVEKALQISYQSGTKIVVTSDIDTAVKTANFIYTDVWVSMGQEQEAETRKKIFKQYMITGEVLSKCAHNCMVLHCLPAHRDEEIESYILDSDRSIVFDQAENRLHVQKALLCTLMKNR